MQLSRIFLEANELINKKKKNAEELKNNISLIKRLNLKENEEKILKSKKSFLSQYEKIFSIVNNIYFILNDESNNFSSELSTNSVKLENLIDKNNEIQELKQISHSINQILIESKEVINNIKLIRENYHFDQKELEEIEQRLFDINNLARKFDTSPSELNQILADLESSFTNIDNEAQKINEINEKLNLAENSFHDLCKKLSLKRDLASKKLQEEINKELIPLRLINSNFTVDIEKKNKEQWNKNGSELVRFLVTLNRGTTEAEIHKVSSGGNYRG